MYGSVAVWTLGSLYGVVVETSAVTLSVIFEGRGIVIVNTGIVGSTVEALNIMYKKSDYPHTRDAVSGFACS